MSSELQHDKRLVVLKSSRARSLAPQIPQRLLLQDRILAREIRELAAERREIRERIRQALERGAACEPGLRSAKIETRRILKIH